MLTLLPAALLASLLTLMSAADLRLPGFDVFTHAEDPKVPEGTVYFHYVGPIDYPMADIISEAWSEHRAGTREVIFEIESWGGPVNHAVEAVEALKAIRRDVVLVTVVRSGGVCASACVPVYMQGEIRRAHPSSAWMFHGAKSTANARASADATRWVTETLAQAGVSSGFLAELAAKGYLSEPGEFWVSGYELENLYHANVITELLPTWTPHTEEQLPFDPALGHR